MVSLVNSHTNATRIGWHLWEVDLRFAPGLPPGRWGSRPRVAPSALHPKPYTLHPTACSLLSTPYTPHHTPYTLHPTPCTLHPAPYTPHHTPYTLHRTPHTLYPTPYTLRPTESSRPHATTSCMAGYEPHHQVMTHPGAESRAKLKSISHRCHLFEVAFE